MKGTGTVISLDRTEAKVAIIRQWALDLGLPNVECHKADSTLLVPYDEATAGEQVGGVDGATADGGKSKKRRGGEGGAAVKEPFRLEPESFDRIVLDPPCTALGLRPRLSIDLPAAEMARTPGYQRRMLHVAAQLLKPGGRLVYSTCTMNPEENECNVAYALRSLPLQLIPAEPRIAPCGRAGCGLTEEQRRMVQRFEPGGELDTNGFFVAAFQKNAQ
jgi:16S rRNA C967 or C1407 C5-methylase (RsmB/RsmF family)